MKSKKVRLNIDEKADRSHEYCNQTEIEYLKYN